jgi:hypothetical protein
LSLAENYKEYRIIFDRTDHKKIEKEIELQLKFDSGLLTPEESENRLLMIVNHNEMLYNATSGLFDETDYTLINIFRYLGLKQRSKTVFRNNAYFISPKIEKILHVAICENLIKYFKV